MASRTLTRRAPAPANAPASGASGAEARRVTAVTHGHRLVGTFGVVAALGMVAACADPFPTTRTPPARGTVGQELYGLVCDRLGAQSLHEDLTGSSFQPICHPDASGNYASKVDQNLLPALNPSAVDVDGHPVSMAVQTQNRNYAVARVEALAHRRSDLIASLDAIFPPIKVNVVDNGNADPTKSCAPNGTDTLSNQLTELLARFQPYYGDGTIPQSTESLARIFDAIKAAPEAQAAFARFQARQGYRPIELTLGVARPAIAYSGLRDLSNAALALLSSDSQPYDTSKVDANGKRVPIVGAANAQFNALIATAHDELLYATQDPAPPLLVDGSGPNDAMIGRTALSRPRTDLELLESLFYANNPVYSTGGSPGFIALRDPRGYAHVALVNNAVPAPFEDTNNDGLADVDNAGNFLTSDGSTPPSPFLAASAQGTAARDTCGRALRSGAAGTPGDGGTGGGTDACGATPGSLIYDYVDTSSVFATALLHNLKPLANPDPTARHETLMYALAGAPVLFGSRDGSPKTSKCYNPDPANPSSCLDPASLLSYDAFETDNSALLDLVYAFGQVLGDPTTDDTLAYVKALFTDQAASLARIAGDALSMKALANKHPEAKIPASSTFWDEMIDTTVKIEQEPGLLEDVLKSLGADGTQKLGQIFANYMTYDDELSYDGTSLASLNSPPLNLTTGVTGGEMVTPVDRTKADTGFNRSAMHRFLSLIHDTDGVTACNKDQAIVIAQGIPLLGSANVCSGGLCSLGSKPFQECAVFKIENLAKFYLDAIVGKATLNFRSDFLKSGILGIGAATVSLVENSSQIGWTSDTTQQSAVNDAYGFWDATNAKVFRPRPQWLNRLVFFDQTTNATKGDPLYTTQQFLSSLQGHIGTSVCPARSIPDPCTTSSDCKDAPDIDQGGQIPGLRTCQDGEWLDQRGKGTIFVWEKFGFYDAITPLLNAFIAHNREDLFIEIMETLYRHWADAQGTADECLLSTDPAKYQQCTKDGLVTYEPLLAQDFAGDILLALHDLEPTLESEKIQSCTAVDPKTHSCTAPPVARDGITVLSNATRALVDPAQALAAKLVDRHGLATALRNDNSTNPQVTPLYLLLQALNGMDAAFAATPTDPNDDRFTQWRTARSQLVDQFLTIDGAGATSSFDNAAIPKFVPTFIDSVRAQLLAQCPTTAVAPNARCAWARDQLTSELATVMHGPVFAATMDLLEAFRKDPVARAQFGKLLQYLLDQASQNDALPSMLATANDLIQLMKDDTNLVPLYKALAPAFEPTKTDAQGNVTQKSVIDASLALLGRLSGRARDASGNEVCSAELDPNQVLTLALENMVTPMTGPTGQVGQAPLQTIMDAIGDVNRGDPSQSSALQATDYANIADNVSSFLLDPTNGMEQFYAIVKNGTVE